MNREIIQLSGAISVSNGADDYVDTFANFLLDYGRPVPALPADATKRHFVRHPGGMTYHTLKNEDGVVINRPADPTGRPSRWMEIIFSLYALKRAQIRRHAIAHTAAILEAANNGDPIASIADGKIAAIQAGAERDVLAITAREDGRVAA